MSFTIKCDNCGNEQVFTNGMTMYADDIEMDLEAEYDNIGNISVLNNITIYCNDCNKWIEIVF